MRKIAFLAALAATLAIRPALAEPAAPVAVELFTSQGCYSCPPAEAYLGDLAKRDDLVVFEWHVDYWDDLVYGSAGQWKDPFSSPYATLRQYSYNDRIEGRRRAYTPQMIVAGAAGMVGSNRAHVERAIAKASKREPTVRLEIVRGPFGEALARATGAPATLWRVDFIRSHVTEVLRGENKGKTLENHHIVVGKTELGLVDGRPVMLAPHQREDLGCAVIAQEGEVGPILAAAYCPEEIGSEEG